MNVTPLTPKANPRAPEPARRSAWLRYAPLGLIGTALAVALLAGLHRSFSLEALVAGREALSGQVAAHPAWALAVYVGLYVAVTALSLPGASLLTVAGGFVFGGLWGGAFAVVGATMGATLLFLAARTSLGASVAARAGPRVAAFRAGFQKDAVSYLLFLRLVSVFPFWLVNLALAVVGVRLWTFVWTTFLGIIPGTFAYALAGAGLDSVAAAQRKAFEACVAAGQQPCAMTLSLHNLVTRELILAFAALGLVALVPMALRRWREARAARQTPKPPRRSPDV
ncbi:MAG: hypothetical protein JWN93_1694 [Hyphomicrobiales bacterium]|nr:hypothetical protein [Hyphomicrobiales bacterium]